MAEGDRPKIILTEEDMGATPPRTEVVPPHDWVAPQPAPSQEPPRAVPAAGAAPPAQGPPQEFPTVRGVGAAPRVVTPGAPAGAPGVTLPEWLNVNTVKGRSLVAAAAGITAGWVVTEATGMAEWTGSSKVHLGVFVAVLGVIFTVAYAGWEQLLARSADGLLHIVRTSGPAGAALGFVSGYLAQVVFVATQENIDATSYQDVRFYLARGLAWGLFGLGMGAASAVLVRSRQKLINGLIGGALGGAVGGIVFHWVVFKMPEHQGTARLIGLLFVGVGIGIAIGLIETARREAWLNVVGGGMTGKEFIIYAAETRVGSDPKCEIVLIKDPAIQPYHFIISTPAGNGQQRRTLTAYQGCEVTIQGQPVAQHVLRDGDVIGAGTTSIRYSERTAQQPLAGSI